MKNILKRVDKVTKTHIYNAYTHTRGGGDDDH